MTGKELHRKLLKRLIPAWLFLTVVTGAAVYFIELRKVDGQVVNLAIRDSEAIIGQYMKHINEPHLFDLDSYIREDHSRSSFMIIELYNRNRELVAEAIRPGAEPTEAEMDTYLHEHLMGTGPQYTKIYRGRQLYLMVVVPLRDPEGAIAGFFEGIYKLDQRTLTDIRDRITGSVLIVVAVVFTTTLMLYPVIVLLNRELVRRSMELYQADIGMVEILGNAIAKRDSDTHIHNYRVTIYAVRLAEAVGVERKAMQGLIKGAFLHDLGKIAISDGILLKPETLSPEEADAMKAHVQHGVDIIRDYQWLSDAVETVANHHEKYDGMGFLKGLKGSEIPYNARIFAICDVFDALTSRRPYKEPFPLEQSIRMIQQMKGSHFDPLLVDSFIPLARELHAAVNGADERRLKMMLEEILDQYFDFRDVVSSY